jgi:hypothetical protein
MEIAATVLALAVLVAGVVYLVKRADKKRPSGSSGGGVKGPPVEQNTSV